MLRCCSAEASKLIEANRREAPCGRPGFRILPLGGDGDGVEEGFGLDREEGIIIESLGGLVSSSPMGGIRCTLGGLPDDDKASMMAEEGEFGTSTIALGLGLSVAAATNTLMASMFGIFFVETAGLFVDQNLGILVFVVGTMTLLTFDSGVAIMIGGRLIFIGCRTGIGIPEFADGRTNH